MNITKIGNHAFSLSLALLTAYAVTMVPSAAMAAGSGPITDALCTVIDWFYGPIGTAIATLAIIIIGVGALMGKVSWGMAIIVGLGVAVIFGAGTIAQSLGASSLSC